MLSKVHSFKEPIDSKRLRLTSTFHFLLKWDVWGSDSHKHSHFTKVGKSQQLGFKVLVQGESTTSSSQVVSKAISELMHRGDATRDLIFRSPGPHDFLLSGVRSLPLPYPQGTRAAPSLLSKLQPILVFHIVNSTQWNAINSPKCPLDIVTSSQDLVWCSL
jgi:hypothetical protein